MLYDRAVAELRERFHGPRALCHLEIAEVFVVIWGSVVVFSNYAWWSYTDTTSPTYCAHTPMLFAFVLLLVSWFIKTF